MNTLAANFPNQSIASPFAVFESPNAPFSILNSRDLIQSQSDPEYNAGEFWWQIYRHVAGFKAQKLTHFTVEHATRLFDEADTIANKLTYAQGLDKELTLIRSLNTAVQGNPNAEEKLKKIFTKRLNNVNGRGGQNDLDKFAEATIQKVEETDPAAAEHLKKLILEVRTQQEEYLAQRKGNRSVQEVARDITGDGNLLAFRMGEGYMIKTGDIFLTPGTTEQEIEQQILYALKYLQDKDPWSCLVTAYGNDEFLDTVKSIFRKYSIRSPLLGHDNAFYMNELAQQVGQNAEANMGKGYWVEHVVLCNPKTGQPYPGDDGKPLLHQVIMWNPKRAYNGGTDPRLSPVRNWAATIPEGGTQSPVVVNPYTRNSQPMVRQGITVELDDNGKIVSSSLFTSSCVKLSDNVLAAINGTDAQGKPILADRAPIERPVAGRPPRLAQD